MDSERFLQLIIWLVAQASPCTHHCCWKTPKGGGGGKKKKGSRFFFLEDDSPKIIYDPTRTRTE